MYKPAMKLSAFVAVVFLLALSPFANTEDDQGNAEQYNRVLKRSLLNIENGEEVQIREILFPPSWKSPRHYHNSDLFIYVISGEFEVDMEGEGLKTLGFQTPAKKFNECVASTL